MTKPQDSLRSAISEFAATHAPFLLSNMHQVASRYYYLCPRHYCHPDDRFLLHVTCTPQHCVLPTLTYNVDHILISEISFTGNSIAQKGCKILPNQGNSGSPIIDPNKVWGFHNQRCTLSPRSLLPADSTRLFLATFFFPSPPVDSTFVLLDALSSPHTMRRRGPPGPVRVIR